MYKIKGAFGKCKILRRTFEEKIIALEEYLTRQWKC